MKDPVSLLEARRISKSHNQPRMRQRLICKTFELYYS